MEKAWALYLWLSWAQMWMATHVSRQRVSGGVVAQHLDGELGIELRHGGAQVAQVAPRAAAQVGDGAERHLTVRVLWRSASKRQASTPNISASWRCSASL